MGLWYTGYNYHAGDVHQTKSSCLGYATSPDGLKWTRYSDRPIFDKVWTEDMQVLRHGDLYWMFAEGRFDIAHWLTSKNGIDWTSRAASTSTMPTASRSVPGPTARLACGSKAAGGICSTSGAIKESGWPPQSTVVGGPTCGTNP